jgi:hypothetical protein
MKKMMFLFPVILFLSSCSSLYDFVNRKDLVPNNDPPEAVSFALENSMVIQWVVDPGAETYLLYKSSYPDGSGSSVIYEGTNLSFTDTSVTDSSFYYYSLQKKKGTNLFNRSSYSHGYVSSVKRDSYEPNNSRATAVNLQDTMYCNIYYFQDDNRNKVIDRDWYYYDIKPRNKLVITFENLNPDLPPDIKLSADDMTPVTIVWNAEVAINNESNQTKRSYLQIIPDETTFLTDLQAKGGKFLSYKIKYIGLIGL